MSDAEKGQLSVSAAEIYEEFFVPALFRQWTEEMADAAGIQKGRVVLDVACGTGVLARELAARVEPGGSVVGLDVNTGMLAVARRQDSRVHWQQGPAEALPFEEHVFHAVVCQFGLMFFEDRIKALREMKRVCRPGGRVVVAVWDALENTPGYAAVTDLLLRLFGEEAANAMRAPFNLGDREEVRALFLEAGLDAHIETVPGEARFPSLRDWMHTDIRGWTLAEMIDDEGFERLVEEGKTALSDFVKPDRTVVFTAPAHIITAEL
jgi:SAM-dependent methyltransferase